jgi:hypothetical protein
MRLVGLSIDSEKVDRARATRSRADVRYFLTEQGIDQAGFADVGSSEKSKLRRTFRGKEFRVGSRGEKFGDDRFHSVTTV